MEYEYHAPWPKPQRKYKGYPLKPETVLPPVLRAL